MVLRMTGAIHDNFLFIQEWFYASRVSQVVTPVPVPARNLAPIPVGSTHYCVIPGTGNTRYNTVCTPLPGIILSLLRT